VFLVFPDESGSLYPSYDSLRNGYGRQHIVTASSPAAFFVLAAVGIRECHTPVVDDWFAAAKRAFLNSPTAAAGQAYEIKGEVLYSLRRGHPPAGWTGTRRNKPHVDAQRRIWRGLAPAQLREFEGSVFDLLVRLSPVVWAIVVIQRDHYRKHKDRAWHPYHYAMTFLQQRVLHHVQASQGAYQRAMFVIDETSTLRTASQFDDYLAMRERINATASWPVEFGRYLVDVAVFGQSHLHQALQLTDVVAHAVYRHVRNDDPLGWFGRIEPLLARHWATGTPRNAGLTFIPR